MTIAELYSQLPLPQLLQTHMLRVAKVGNWLVKNWSGPEFDTQLLRRTILVHDLGNLVKFDLTPSAKIKLLTDAEITHWRKVQAELIVKYGRDTDQVTISLLKTCNLDGGDVVATEIAKHTSQGLEDAVRENDWVQKLFAYSDFRVGPYGVLSLQQRFADLAERYQNREVEWGDPEWVASRLQLYLTMEQQISKQLSVSLDELTDQALQAWSDQEILESNW
jgi:hypothetical protein